MRTRIRTALVALMLLALGACAPATQEESEVAPDLAGQGLHGEHLDLADLRGSVVIVAAWASWCTICRAEMPVFARAQQTFAEDGLELIGINMRDRPDPARAVLAEEDLDLPSIHDADGTISVHWGIRGLPTTFLIDRDGHVLDVHHGQVTQDWIDEVVQPAVTS